MEGLKIEQLHGTADILGALMYLGKDLHNQELNAPENLKLLADKYSQNAVVYSGMGGVKPKGICAFYCNDKTTKTAFLTMIVVDKQEQGKGLGSLLLDKMVWHCRTEGMKRIRLEVACDNERAYHFYVRHGFQQEKIQNRIGNYLMNKDI